ncbi:MAG: DUF2274 domain-containing protein [Hyphomonadaceae bacterium]|nr:DUF2274 domain-containing protein [Hyphomonadaceae bacterium]
MNAPNLKIGPLPDTTPVKLTIAVDPHINADLELYAQIYEETYKEKASVAALIPSMLEAFLASDSGFKKVRKARGSQSKPSQ